ncbi:conserved protein of unknown function [Pseudodesulfovibrio profundus]|jgi:Zn-finger nucleic acid-binding protein|uniref:Transcription factor zinc-finger domain-containing protein n=2 Tax=Pseudodesulfovibrio profundus TaxID=57320 RepID=A0A2C8F6Q4_9BACT|nr:conserved protein of unknown function [Pseudodesulfovibrio profundus]
MKCPVCKETNLVMTERQSIEIDYCPECRGVWLDRGELDKIIERSMQEAVPSGKEPYRDTGRDHGVEQRYPQGDRHHDYKHKQHKRKSLLGELFDF